MISVAIIGLGIMGRRMLEHMALHPNYKPVAMWDPDPKACRASQAVSPETQVSASPSAAIAHADLVYLACPPAPRKALAIEAANAQKAVFLEKPLGVDIAQSEELVANLQASGVPAAVNFTQAAGSALSGVVAAARSGEMGELVGADIVINYSVWPRTWQKAADWLRFRDEGGVSREVISHFLFFSERVLGPLSVQWSKPVYPKDEKLCETHMFARLETAAGLPVSIMASVGGAQPDRQELTIKGSLASRRVSEFHIDAVSRGEPFVELEERAADPRAESLKVQLDELSLCVDGKPNQLATVEEALRVQKLVEKLLVGTG